MMLAGIGASKYYRDAVSQKCKGPGELEVNFVLYGV